MKTLLAILLAVVCPWVYAQQPIDPVRVQGIIDAVSAQRNEAQNQVAALAGELAVVKEQLKTATDRAVSCK